MFVTSSRASVGTTAPYPFRVPPCTLNVTERVDTAEAGSPRVVGASKVSGHGSGGA